MADTYRVTTAESATDHAAVRELLEEYRAWLGKVVSSQRLDDEIGGLPGPYAAPRGRLYLARDGEGRPVGTVGIRPHHGAACEIKRLYVRPLARESGLGRRLAETAVAAAVELGYDEALMTTLPQTMGPALALYRSLGFVDTEPFLDHSHVSEGVEMLYLSLRLNDHPEGASRR